MDQLFMVIPWVIVFILLLLLKSEYYESKRNRYAKGGLIKDEWHTHDVCKKDECADKSKEESIQEPKQPIKVKFKQYHNEDEYPRETYYQCGNCGSYNVSLPERTKIYAGTLIGSFSNNEIICDDCGAIHADDKPKVLTKEEIQEFINKEYIPKL